MYQGEGAIPYMSIKRAFAESRNAAVLNALKEYGVTESEVLDFTEKLNFNLSDSHAGTPAVTNLTLGNFSSRPADVQKLMNRALNYSLGDYSHVNDMRLVSDYKISENADSVEASSHFLGQQQGGMPSSFLRKVLEAPICFKGKNSTSTLRKINHLCANLDNRIDLHIAKTGTSGALQSPNSSSGIVFNESDWWITGGLQFEDGRKYTYLILLGAGEPSLPFSRNLGAGTLAPIVEVIVDDLYSVGE
jgi:membrane peptidoglycan carboxypeptidase